MNRELFQLAVQGLRRRRKSSLLVFAVLCLSFCFAIITLSVSGSMIKTNEEYRLDTFGQWQGAVVDGMPEDEAFLRGEEWVLRLGTSQNAGTISTERGQAFIGFVDEDFLQIGRLGLQEGRLPENENEIALEADVLSMLGYDYAIGQTVTVPISFSTDKALVRVDLEKDFTLCGVIREYADLWAADSTITLPLNSAIITPAAAEELDALAKAKASEMMAEAKAAIEEAKKKGDESEERLSQQAEFAILQESPLYIFTSARETEDIKGLLGKDLLSRFVGNTLAYGETREAEVYQVYVWLIFGVTVFAVLCIYAIQMQKQVRQYALFRSIGIKKSQLRKLVLFETLLLCVPAAVFGAAFGAFGTWAVLKLAVYSGSVPVQVSIPWTLLGPLALVWFFGIVLARLVILQIALREPLTGRIAMESKKARRWKRAQKALIGALSALFGAVTVFTVMNSSVFFNRIDIQSNYPSYTFNNGGGYAEKKGPLITEKLIQTLEAVPGVKKVRVVGSLEAELTFEGMEENDFFNLAKEVREYEMGTVSGEISKYEDGLGVRVYAVPEGNYEDYLRPREIGLDVEAFREGEQVVVSFPQDTDGRFYLNYPIYAEDVDGEGGYSISTERRSANDTGLRSGDSVHLRFYGKEALTHDPQAREQLSEFEVPVGAILPLTGTGKNAPAGLDGNFDPYVVWCSEAFAKKVFASAQEFPQKGYVVGNYSIKSAGKSFGYTDGEILTDGNAGYLSTDAVAAQICGQNRVTFSNDREFWSAAIQEQFQTLILLFAGGGCVFLVLILLLGNTQAMETKREKKSFGILQALGMSKRQLKGKLKLSAFSRGLLGALVGWTVMGGYVILSAYRSYLALLEGPEELWLTPMEALGEQIDSFLAAGANLRTVLLLTAGIIVLAAFITLLSKRSLLRGGPMEKLRDEE